MNPVADDSNARRTPDAEGQNEAEPPTLSVEDYVAARIYGEAPKLHSIPLPQDQINLIWKRCAGLANNHRYADLVARRNVLDESYQKLRKAHMNEDIFQILNLTPLKSGTASYYSAESSPSSQGGSELQPSSPDPLAYSHLMEEELDPFDPLDEEPPYDPRAEVTPYRRAPVSLEEIEWYKIQPDADPEALRNIDDFIPSVINHINELMSRALTEIYLIDICIHQSIYHETVSEITPTYSSKWHDSVLIWSNHIKSDHTKLKYIISGFNRLISTKGLSPSNLMHGDDPDSRNINAKISRSLLASLNIRSGSVTELLDTLLEEGGLPRQKNPRTAFDRIVSDIRLPDGSPLTAVPTYPNGKRRKRSAVDVLVPLCRAVAYARIGGLIP